MFTPASDPLPPSQLSLLLDYAHGAVEHTPDMDKLLQGAVEASVASVPGVPAEWTGAALAAVSRGIAKGVSVHGLPASVNLRLREGAVGGDSFLALVADVGAQLRLQAPWLALSALGATDLFGLNPFLVLRDLQAGMTSGVSDSLAGFRAGDVGAGVAGLAGVVGNTLGSVVGGVGRVTGMLSHGSGRLLANVVPPPTQDAQASAGGVALGMLKGFGALLAAPVFGVAKGVTLGLNKVESTLKTGSHKEVYDASEKRREGVPRKFAGEAGVVVCREG